MKQILSQFLLVATLLVLVQGNGIAQHVSDTSSATGTHSTATKSGMDLDAIFNGGTPQTTAELQAMQLHFQELVKRLRPATVGVRVGAGQGSGVIVSRDGYVLTAAHVIGEAGVDAVIVLPDGKEVKAKTMGLNHAIDSGLLKITTEGDYDYLDMGESSSLKKGQWVMSIGHPGGFDIDRAPVVRIGRLQSVSNSVLQSDCTLVGGDSGGPLFDMNGNVIGIHSRIGLTLNDNMHVPIDTYLETWDRLADGEEWGRMQFSMGYFGFSLKEGSLEIEDVTERGPADRAGFKVGDVIVEVDGNPVENQLELRRLQFRQRPGSKLQFKVKRDGKDVDLELTVGRRN